MARSRGRIRFTRPPAKTKIWIGNNVAVVTLTSGAQQLIASLNAAALLLRPFTILRTRIDLLFRSDQAATDEAPSGGFSMIVVKETAAAVGVSALPGPLAEIDADHFVYQGMTTAVLSATSVGVTAPVGTRYMIDSKAMRKVGPQDDVAIQGELRSVGGAFLNMEGRMLLQLH